MAIVTGGKERWRVWAAHAGLIALIAITLFPLLAVVSISLRPGNFSTGSLIPEHISLEHWKLALGMTTPCGAPIGIIGHQGPTRNERCCGREKARGGDAAAPVNC